ncbi:MAG: hypothetical protein ABW095_07405 [Candidatus Thiodiazotropha sp.]
MAGGKIPGTEGLNQTSTPDKGTLARTRTNPPGVDLKYSWDSRKKEGITQSVPILRSDAYAKSPGKLVGKVYFPVNVDKLDTDDMLHLGPLANSLIQRIKEEFEITLYCVGRADYRASDAYNMDLSRRRQDNVAKFLKRYVLGSDTATNPLFTVKTLDPLGEMIATQPGEGAKRPSEWVMGRDRSVIIWTERHSLLPPVYLAFEGDLMYSKSIEPMEINAGGKIAPKVVTRADEAKDAIDERNKQRQKGITKQPDDPFRAVIDVKVTFQIVQESGEKKGQLQINVVQRETGKTLYRVQHYSENMLEKYNVKGDATLRDFDYKAIYRKLTGGYINITARVTAMLGRKSAKI